jgi:hypothetical protein
MVVLPPRGEADRPRLLGMYLVQASRRMGSCMRGSGTRERQNGGGDEEELKQD